MRKILYISVVLALFVGCKSDKPLPEPVIVEIVMDEDKYQLDHTGQTLTLEFRTNAQYSFEIGAEWITPMEDSRAMESYTQSFAVAANDSADMRSTYIKIIAGEVEYTVTVEQAGKPEMFHLTLKHSQKQLQSPEWSGESIRGEVDWGDGTTEEYKEGISHTYTSDGQYKAKFEMENIEGFEIEQLGDIEHLNIAM